MSFNIESGISIEGGISITIDTGVPTNTVAPVITDSTPNVRIGTTVTSTTGTWNGSFPTLGYRYQWLSNSSNIANATSNTYLIQSSDLSHYLSCNVIAYSSYGNSAPATSNTLGPVLPAVVDPAIGTFIYGGYYSGTTTISGSQYYIIVASTSASYTTFGTITNVRNSVNALVLNGYSDWILPDKTTLGIMCYYKTDFASIGQAYNTSAGAAGIYWSTTIVGGFYIGIAFNNLCQEYEEVDYNLISGRAIRLQPRPT
jgi:hypothetical protein